MGLKLVSPERWYIAFWLLVGLVYMSPVYYFLYRIWRK